MSKLRGSEAIPLLNKKGQERRAFLRKTTGLTFCFAVGHLLGCSNNKSELTAADRETDFPVNAWVNIAANGIVTIAAPADEMGQGSFTALPLILAEELDVDWDDVRIEISPTDEQVYGNPEFFGMIYTAASMSVTGYFDQLRLYGAQARRILMENAAHKWGVPVAELTTEPSVVVHAKSGRRLSFGAIAAFAEQPQELPKIDKSALKSPDQFRLIGHSVPRRDVPDKVLGISPYAINANPPGLIFATAVRAPVMGAEVAEVDDSETLGMRGVLGVYVRNRSVIVAADSFFHALSARRKLAIKWTSVGNVNHFDSDRAIDDHARMARNLEIPGEHWEEQGELQQGFESPARIFEQEYRTDYLYHAQIEPLNATVWVKEDGRVEAWVGTQAPAVTVNAIAKTLNIDAGRIELHRAMIGGAFGRRTVSEMDYVVDAAWLSGQLQKPVKVIWSREDDIASAWHKPMTGQFLRAAVNAAGKISGWHHRVAVQEPLATAEPAIYEAMDKIPLVSMMGSEQPVYNFPNRLAERLVVEPGIRTYPLLAVGTTPNQFASESFIDEIATQLGKDPLAYRRELLRHSSRALKVVENVAQMSEWGKPRQLGRALGIAFCQYHQKSLLAGVAEISYDPERYKITVHNIWVSIDPGLAVQPDNIRAQVEGAVIFGLGGALSERTTFKQGLVQQTNYHNYLIPRIKDIPNIQVSVISNNAAHPHAVGQTGAIVVAPAIANAFASLTGARLRHMPFTTDRVRKAVEKIASSMS